MRGTTSKVLRFFGLALVLAACGGSSPPADSPDSGQEFEANEPTSSVGEERASDSDSDSDVAPEPKPEAGPEPQFTDGMSVDQAMAAVPQGVERTNIDAETLGKPLQNVEFYEPCKPGNAKVKLRVAVWDGKAVGVDATTTPKNPRLSDCISEKIRELTWDKKVKSLNTVEYQF